MKPNSWSYFIIMSISIMHQLHHCHQNTAQFVYFYSILSFNFIEIRSMGAANGSQPMSITGSPSSGVGDLPIYVIKRTNSLLKTHWLLMKANYSYKYSNVWKPTVFKLSVVATDKKTNIIIYQYRQRSTCDTLFNLWIWNISHIYNNKRFNSKYRLFASIMCYL
jgi:hypothetical protein